MSNAIDIGEKTGKFFEALATSNADSSFGVSRTDLQVLYPLAKEALPELENLGSLSGKKGEKLERKISFIKGIIGAAEAIPVR